MQKLGRSEGYEIMLQVFYIEEHTNASSPFHEAVYV